MKSNKELERGLCIASIQSNKACKRIIFNSIVDLSTPSKAPIHMTHNETAFQTTPLPHLLKRRFKHALRSHKTLYLGFRILLVFNVCKIKTAGFKSPRKNMIKQESFAGLLLNFHKEVDQKAAACVSYGNRNWKNISSQFQ